MKEVLLIEDDDDIHVHLAENGQDGLQCLYNLEKPPSLILLDLYMPMMDGSSFLKEVKENYKFFSSVPILVMTAASVGEYPKDFDPKMILKKPINLDDLFSKIESLLS
jgi:two-component system, chemotaxis family, chemotaxis protein CheY